MARMAWYWSKKKPRSYFESWEGKRVTVGRFKCMIVRLFGERVMSTKTVNIYKFRGLFYVLK